MDQSWLPDIVEANYRRMLADGSLSVSERAFFTDFKLKKFWSKVDKYLSDLQVSDKGVACAHLVGCFLVPIKFEYGKTGKVNNPTIKTNIRGAQKKAYTTIKSISRLAGDLATALDELESTQQFYPDGTELLSIVKQLIDEEPLKNLPSYCGRVRTSEALRILETNFREFPEAGELFKEVPGMASQKSSWADWMREVESNIQEALNIWPGDLKLLEADWINLAKVLIGDHITRNAVQSAMKKN